MNNEVKFFWLTKVKFQRIFSFYLMLKLCSPTFICHSHATIDQYMSKCVSRAAANQRWLPRQHQFSSWRSRSRHAAHLPLLLRLLLSPLLPGTRRRMSAALPPRSITCRPQVRLQDSCNTMASEPLLPPPSDLLTFSSCRLVLGLHLRGSGSWGSSPEVWGHVSASWQQPPTPPAGTVGKHLLRTH